MKITTLPTSLCVTVSPCSVAISPCCLCPSKPNRFLFLMMIIIIIIIIIDYYDCYYYHSSISSTPFLTKLFQVGPALVYLVFDCPFGKGAFVQSLLPVGPLEQIVTHEVWGEWKLPSVVAKFMLQGEAMQVERDVMVWNNKRFNNKPVLTKDEGLILQFRRWFTQFYSENSRAVAEKSVNALDW